ncbi:hypothetical protein T492DRAFT_623145, partial [Pavlovales sp. CCMP2436]
MWGYVLLAICATEPVSLGGAGAFTVLAKTAITTDGTTTILGDIAISPAFAAAMTGFGLILDSSGEFATSSIVVGQVYASDYASPTPTVLAATIFEMEAAYDDATSRPVSDAVSRPHSLPSSQFVDVGAGAIAGQTFTPGVYSWNSFVHVSSPIFVKGGRDDIWVFKVA